jgi:hypothetical protein
MLARNDARRRGEDPKSRFTLFCFWSEAQLKKTAEKFGPGIVYLGQ